MATCAEFAHVHRVHVMRRKMCIFNHLVIAYAFTYVFVLKIGQCDSWRHVIIPRRSGYPVFSTDRANLRCVDELFVAETLSQG